jgi:hypothetical protein
MNTSRIQVHLDEQSNLLFMIPNAHVRKQKHKSSLFQLLMKTFLRSGQAEWSEASCLVLCKDIIVVTGFTYSQLCQVLEKALYE